MDDYTILAKDLPEGVEAVAVDRTGMLQHPYKQQGNLWMGHCNNCGDYVDDYEEEPPVDFLCEACEAEE